MTYYNELEPYAAEWLRRLVAGKHLAPGEVDERDIREVKPDDVKDRQCHFFAGLGGWSRAFRLAGVPDDASIWTGSCPCQPFSQAGRKTGVEDSRHLWPIWYRLIQECRPPVVFGEQVSSPAGLAWFDAVSADLEAAGYSVGAADLCAASVGAPHIRQRLYFVALADDYQGGRALLGPSRLHDPGQPGDDAAGRGEVGGVGDAGSDGAGEHRRELRGHEEEYDFGTAYRHNAPLAPGPTRGAWERADWVLCRDRRWRPVEPGTFPLADGATARVGRLRAYGNAIVPELAATFIRAALGG
jgi:DNA (cytosine-5)-methyltransferase 1